MLLLLLLILLVFSPSTALIATSLPPLPLLPIPSARQLKFQQRRLSLFFHFGINTFTGVERGSGHEDPALFFPASLNASQWMEAAIAAGAELVILTAKHHDGFCLWPSQFTDFSVRSSPWRSGSGDVVAEFTSAAKQYGLDVGIYLSPWDMHEDCYGQQLAYNEFYLAQLRELLTRYGRISEVWLDGAKGPGAPDMNYLFESWFSTIHQLQPDANIFSDAGPDIRWVGNEYAEAGSTCWSMVNKSGIVIGHSDSRYLETGDISGKDWVPAECDISIRPGWFWHEHEAPKSAHKLLDVYFRSAGRNCLLLLNVPPNSSGLIDERDVDVLRQFRHAVDSIFATNLAARATALAASSARSPPAYSAVNVLDGDPATYWAAGTGELSGWLQLGFFRGSEVTFNVVEVQEAVSMGQRVMEYRVEARDGEEWRLVVAGTTIGYRRLHRVLATTTRLVRLVIVSSRAEPLITSFGLYCDPSYYQLPAAGCDDGLTLEPFR